MEMKQKCLMRLKWALPTGLLCFFVAMVLKHFAQDEFFLVGFFEGASASLMLLGILVWSKIERDKKKSERHEDE